VEEVYDEDSSSLITPHFATRGRLLNTVQGCIIITAAVKEVVLLMFRYRHLNFTLEDFVFICIRSSGDNIDTIMKNTQALIDASKGVSLEVNREKNEYMLLSRHENAGQNHDIKRADRCFENMAQLRYFGATVTNQNLIHEKIKKKLNSGKTCYHSVKNLLSSRLLSKKYKN
jgi:ribosomal protein S2